MRKITEIKNDYTDDENLTHIDAYFDDNSEGKTIAVVCQDTGKVIFFDNAYRLDELVLKAIEEVKALIYNKVIYAKAVLKNAGYYTDILWCNDDAKGNFECTDEQANELIGQALNNDATVEQIWFAMNFHGEEKGYVKINKE